MSTRLTLGDIEVAKHKVLRRGIHTLTYRGMVLSFIAELTKLNAYVLSFQEIINECNKNDWLKIDFEYKNESDFYKIFCSKKMYIEREPQSYYFLIRNAVLKKIKEIENRLNELYALRAKAKGKIPTIKNIENYNENYSLITFYIEKNKKALNEIKLFLINGIDGKAISKCIERPFSSPLHDFAFFVPLFPHQNSWLDLTARSILMHRYGDLDVQTANTIFELYDKYLENKSVEYAEIPLAFLEGRNKFDELLTLCKTHPLLDRRMVLIRKCISLYKRKEYSLVVILIPTLIEGLINDVCMMYELKKEDIYQRGFTKKINFIQSRHRSRDFGRSLYSLDYFRYFFPSIRNHMAHGWVEKSKEMEVLSGHLMLDLISACEVVIKADYKMNIHVDSLNKLSNFDGSDTNLIDVYMTFLGNELLGFPCHAFYKKNKLIKRLKSLYLEEKFKITIVSSITSDDLKFKKLCRSVTDIQKIALKNNFSKHYEASKKLLENMRLVFKDKKAAQAAKVAEFRKKINGGNAGDN